MFHSTPDVHRASTMLPTSPTVLSDVTVVDSVQNTTTRLMTSDDTSLKAGVKGSSDPATAQALAMAQLGIKYSLVHKQPAKRLVQKTGDCNVTAKNITKRKRKFLFDLFTTMVDLRWRWHILAFVAVFVVTWSAFATVWLLIAIVHGDTIHDSIRFNNNNNDTAADSDNGNHAACVDNVHDFISALLFSIETQATIGYGYRVIQTECVSAIVVLMLQTCVGLFIQALATGIIFAKISRPKSRAQTILFSQRAVVCKRDGDYCLLFRVGDMRRRSHIIGTSVRALLVRNRLTKEGELIPLCQSSLALETDTSISDSFLFLVWPVTVTHRIDSTSPLWETSSEDLFTTSARFEIIVILEGTIESTGMLTQVRTSYLPKEIMWGQRLSPLMTYQRENGRYEIDYEQFHQTTPIASMPECSAKEWAAKTAATGRGGEEIGVTAGGVPIAGTAATIDRPCDYPISFTTPAIRSLMSAPRRPGTSSGGPHSIRQLIQRNRLKQANKAAAAGKVKPFRHRSSILPGRSSDIFKPPAPRPLLPAAAAAVPVAVPTTSGSRSAGRAGQPQSSLSSRFSVSVVTPTLKPDSPGLMFTPLNCLPGTPPGVVIPAPAAAVVVAYPAAPPACCSNGIKNNNDAGDVIDDLFEMELARFSSENENDANKHLDSAHVL